MAKGQGSTYRYRFGREGSNATPLEQARAMEEQCPYVLRPHQVRGRTLIRSEILKGHRSPLAVMATGGGKTLLAALGFIKPAVEKGKRVLFMAHSRELINQPSVKLDEIGLHDHGIIMANHWRKRPGAPIQIGTIQTMARRMSRLDLYY